MIYARLFWLYAPFFLSTHLCQNYLGNQVFGYLLYQKVMYMVGDILNQGGEWLQNPSTPQAVDNYNNFFEDN